MSLRRLSVALVLLGLALGAPGGALAAAPKTSLADLEDEVMCVTCRIPLQIAESPEASRQRVFIRRLIAQGKTKEEIKRALVAQYGERVLAVPGDEGIDLAAWIVPGAAILLALGGLGVLLTRSRRRRRAAPGEPAAAPLPAADARRLDDELARFDA